MKLEPVDKQALLELKHSRGWEILCLDIDERIDDLNELLLNPNLEEVIGDDPIKQLHLLNQKKIERAYLVGLKDKPQDLLNSFIQ